MKNTIGRFLNTYTVDEAAYKEKKRQSLRRLKGTKQIYYKKQFDTLIATIKYVEKLTAIQIKEKYNVDLTERQIQFIYKSEFEKGNIDTSAENETDSEDKSIFNLSNDENKKNEESEE